MKDYRFLNRMWSAEMNKTIKTLLFITVALSLGACGSDDKLPGGTNPGDQDPLAEGTPLFYIERQVTSERQGRDAAHR